MKEIRIHAWCDACLSEHGIDTRVEATHTHTMTLADGKTRTIDLCEEHDEQLVAPLAKLLADVGISPGGTPPAGRSEGDETTATQDAFAFRYASDERAASPWQCPICASTVRHSTATRHIYAKHVDGGFPVLAACPDCDYESDSAGAVASHRVRTHGVDLIDEALAKAGVK